MSQESAVPVPQVLVIGTENCGKTTLIQQLKTLGKDGLLLDPATLPVARTVGQEIHAVVLSHGSLQRHAAPRQLLSSSAQTGSCAHPFESDDAYSASKEDRKGMRVASQNLKMKEIGGSMISFWHRHIKPEISAIMFVVDASDATSIPTASIEIMRLIEKVLQEEEKEREEGADPEKNNIGKTEAATISKNTKTKQHHRRIPILICVNKALMPSAIPFPEVVDLLGLHLLSAPYGAIAEDEMQKGKRKGGSIDTEYCSSCTCSCGCCFCPKRKYTAGKFFQCCQSRLPPCEGPSQRQRRRQGEHASGVEPASVSPHEGGEDTATYYNVEQEGDGYNQPQQPSGSTSPSDKNSRKLCGSWCGGQLPVSIASSSSSTSSSSLLDVVVLEVDGWGGLGLGDVCLWLQCKVLSASSLAD